MERLELGWQDGVQPNATTIKFGKYIDCETVSGKAHRSKSDSYCIGQPYLPMRYHARTPITSLLSIDPRKGLTGSNMRTGKPEGA